jgi:hypothetical protein
MSESSNNSRNHEDNLSQQVREFVSSPEERNFGSLAQDLFEHQFSTNLPYRRYARSLGRTPETINSWQEIPAVPTSAFKLAEFPLISGQFEWTKRFLTSGTTTETRGIHYLPDTRLYEHSLLATWKSRDFPKLPHLYLAPSPGELPESSLSHMFGTLGSTLPDPFLLKNDRFHLEPLFTQISTGHPVFLMGTALAFLHLMETLGPISLPAGSQILETGGYKGTKHTLAKDDFYTQLRQFFGIAGSDIHNEYGMTELSTQAYATGSDGTHHFPTWCRHQILDPGTGGEVPPGEIGYLQIHDLANVHSVAAIRTQDLAIGHEDGSFTLIGRDPGALPRGCSRSIDQSLSS